jgi:hypothetical protein
MILDPSGQPIPKTLTEAEAVALAAAEMQALPDPMGIALRPLSAFRIAALLQLALRHPDLAGENRETAWNFLEAVREYFAACPTVLLMLDAGDDPTQDVGGEDEDDPSDPFLDALAADDLADHALDPLNVYPPDARADHDLGPCCVCETTTDVHNILMLRSKAPITGHGWGCVACELAPDGALAVVCDGCLGQPLKFACRGYPASDGRIAITELAGTHEHDLTRHQYDA